MLRYAGYEIKITQSIVRDHSDLPGELKGAYDVVLNVDESVQCRQISPTNLFMDVDLSEIYPNDRISIRIDSNINMSYWIVVVVKRIDLIVDHADKLDIINDDVDIVATFKDVICANIMQLYIPECTKSAIDLVPGYRYILYNTINPWIKMNPVVTVDHSNITITPGQNDWQIVIHYMQTGEYIVAVRSGADRYRTAPRWDGALADFVDIYKCLYLDLELDPELNGVDTIDDTTDSEID